MSADGEALTRPERAARRIAELARGSGTGARLGTKDELRHTCGVSVGTLNEALRLAQSRGLIEVRPGPGGGIFAAEQSPLVRLGNSVLALDAEETSVADAIRIRDHLDRLVITDAAWHSSPADIAAYRAQLEAMAAAARDADATAFMEANWHLHELFVGVNPSPMVRAIYTPLLEIIRAHTLGIHAAEGHTADELMSTRHQVHVDLVEAIASGDTAGLQSAISAHSVEHANDYQAQQARHPDRTPHR